MKKKIKNMRYGFTVAELLITMFIAMIVAAAMVPLIGPKKIKFPEFNKVHGIYACYWDNEGNLQAYYADTKQKAPYNTGDLVQGNYCTFPAQANADHFEIYAITSGSPGYLNNLNAELSLNAVVSQSSSPINQGDISLERYKSDIDNIVANVDDDLYRVIDNNNKIMLLRDMVRRTITDWSKNGEGKNKPYAVITALNTALGRGGGGIARKFTVDKTAKSGGGYTECTVDAQEDPQQMFRPDEGFTMAKPNDASAVSYFKQLITMNSKCYGYLHLAGSDSRPGIQLKPDFKILLPVNAESTYIDRTFNEKNGTAYTNVSFGVNNVFKAPTVQVPNVPKAGHDAYYDAENNVLKVDDANDPLFKHPYVGTSVNLQSDATIGQIRFLDANDRIHDFTAGDKFQKIGDSNNDNLAFKAVANPGTSHGIEVNEGGVCYKINGVCQDNPPEIQNQAFIDYMNERAFSWSQNGLAATINYIRAGKPGREKVYRTSDLGGNPLYLFPSKDDYTTATVVSKGREIGDTHTKEYVVSAPPIGIADIGGGSTQEPTYLLHMNELPFPIDSIVNQTIPNNNNLTYVSKIRSSRFRNALGTICNNNSDDFGNALEGCPGFGGAGAYPLLSNFLRAFTVTVTNNQEGLRGQSHSFEFNSGQNYNYRAENKMSEQANIKCRNEGESFRLNNVDVCRGSRQQRGRGAVIILW